MDGDSAPLRPGTSPTSAAAAAFSPHDNSGNMNLGLGSPTSGTHVFEDLLDAEVVVNVGKLREAARQGIDPAYRSVVYRYLLGVAYADKSREMTMERDLEKDFDHIAATYSRLWMPAEGDDDNGGDGGGAGRGSGGGGGSGKGAGERRQPYGHYLNPSEGLAVPFVSAGDSRDADSALRRARGTEESHAAWVAIGSRLRHRESYARDAERRERLDSTLAALAVYYHGASQYDVGVIVALMLPIDDISTHARDVFFCVQSLYYLLTHYGNILQDRRSLQTHCGNFLLLFRTTNIALYEHFFTEGVATLEWVPDMLTTLLAGRLDPEDLLRLWDLYLADIWGTLSVPLHPYVVLAILAEMTEDLIECEKSEILSRLRNLPRIDAASILQSATSIRESVFAKGLLPPASQDGK